MSRSVRILLLALIGACASTVLASAQATSSPTDVRPQTTTTSAYVYVTIQLSDNTSELDGYSADSNGTLTSLAGSPFWTSKVSDLTGLTNTAHWLFVSDGTYIYSFSIASNGTLKQVSSVNAAQYYGFPGGFAGAGLTLDHTGSTLYALADDGLGDNQFQFFAKNSATGALTYFGSTDVGIAYGELAFTGNNVHAYGFGCFQDESHAYGFSRGSDGTLTTLNLNVPIPTYPNGDYCLDLAGADPASNLAVAMYLETPSQPPSPPAWLAVYTAGSSGNLTTNSTYQNMPTAAVGWLNDNPVASPTGNLLAVGGSSGLQVFHFNGSNQITAFSGLLATHPINQVAWDSHNHLYGISSSGRLYSFTVTTTGYKQDPGSPYTITNPRAITVLSK